MEQQVVDMNLLAHYKDLYSGHKIIYVRFLNEDFVFKSLTHKEYKYIIQKQKSQYCITNLNITATRIG